MDKKDDGHIWGSFVIYVLATSIIGLFIASFVLKEEITLAKMNEWVSLVLGLVALFIGIISLFLSFYNVDQSVQSQKQSMEIMNSVNEDIKGTITEYKTVDHPRISAPNRLNKGDWSEF